MADRFEIEIVTPDRLVVKDYAEEMQIPGKDGYSWASSPATPRSITELDVGEITYRTDIQTERLAVVLGFRRRSCRTKLRCSAGDSGASKARSTFPGRKKPGTGAEEKLKSGDPEVKLSANPP